MKKNDRIVATVAIIAIVVLCLAVTIVAGIVINSSVKAASFVEKTDEVEDVDELDEVEDVDEPDEVEDVDEPDEVEDVDEPDEVEDVDEPDKPEPTYWSDYSCSDLGSCTIAVAPAGGFTIGFTREEVGTCSWKLYEAGENISYQGIHEIHSYKGTLPLTSLEGFVKSQFQFVDACTN